MFLVWKCFDQTYFRRPFLLGADRWAASRLCPLTAPSLSADSHRPCSEVRGPLTLAADPASLSRLNRLSWRPPGSSRTAPGLQGWTLSCLLGVASASSRGLTRACALMDAGAIAAGQCARGVVHRCVQTLCPFTQGLSLCPAQPGPLTPEQVLCLVLDTWGNMRPWCYQPPRLLGGAGPGPGGLGHPCPPPHPQLVSPEIGLR